MNLSTYPDAAASRSASVLSLAPQASVIRLPTAAAQPVVQTRRCGRLPKCIPSLRVLREERTRQAAIAEAKKIRAGDLVLVQEDGNSNNGRLGRVLKFDGDRGAWVIEAVATPFDILGEAGAPVKVGLIHETSLVLVDRAAIRRVS